MLGILFMFTNGIGSCIWEEERTITNAEAAPAGSIRKSSKRYYCRVRRAKKRGLHLHFNGSYEGMTSFLVKHRRYGLRMIVYIFMTPS
jgi:hypothetical protein